MPPWVIGPGWRATILLFCSAHFPSGNWKSISSKMFQPRRLLLVLKEHWRKPTGAEETKGRVPMCDAVFMCGEPSAPHGKRWRREGSEGR